MVTTAGQTNQSFLGGCTRGSNHAEYYHIQERAGALLAPAIRLKRPFLGTWLTQSALIRKPGLSDLERRLNRFQTGKHDFTLFIKLSLEAMALLLIF